MQALFSYAELAEVAYIAAAAGIALTPAQQSLAVQAVALLENPSAWTDYDTYGDDIDALVAATSDALLTTEIPPPVVGMLSETTITPITMDVSAGNAITGQIDALQRNNIFYFQNPAIQSQILSTGRYLAAGDWNYRFTSARGANSAILQMRIGSIAAGNVVTVNHDLYVAGATQRNQYQTGTFTLPDNDFYFIDFATNGKHASSGGYQMLITCLEMWRVP